MTSIRARRRGADVSASVPIPVAADGTVGRKCPSCRRYFKVEAQALAGATHLWCPYCGAESGRDDFLTLDQRRRIRSAALRLALDETSRMFEEALRPLNRFKSGLVQIRFERGRVETPALLTYLERATVRAKTCEDCDSRSAVYGIAVVCPVCGRRDPMEMFIESLEATRACLVAAADLPADRRQVLEASGGEDRLAEGAVRDSVAAFEAYCKARYEGILGAAALQALLRARGPAIFQRLDDATSVMEVALEKPLENALSDAERDELQRTFATRHVLTHSFGVSDDRYLTSGGATPLGQRVQVTSTMADRALFLIERLVRAMN